jgi:hypothetical protein
VSRVVFFAVLFSVELGIVYLAGTEETRAGLREIARNGWVQVLLAVAVVIFFATYCWRRAYLDWRTGRNALLRWEDDRRAYRARAEEAARQYEPGGLLWTPTPGQDLTNSLFPGAKPPSESSLLDGSPGGPLPDELRAPWGAVVKFKTPNDRGPRAA